MTLIIVCIIRIILKQARRMLNNIYISLLDKWVHTIEKYNERSTDLFQEFQKELFKKTQMEIAYDSDILSIIVNKVNQLDIEILKPRGQNRVQYQKLNDLLLIVKSLYNNLFISGKDLVFFMKKIDLNLAHIEQFINSSLYPIGQRWNRFIPFQMNIFWFVIPFKGIDRSLQILLYQTTKPCLQLEQAQQIQSYILTIKKKGEFKESSFEQSYIFGDKLFDETVQSSQNIASYQKWTLDLSQIKKTNQSNDSDSNQV